MRVSKDVAGYRRAGVWLAGALGVAAIWACAPEGPGSGAQDDGLLGGASLLEESEDAPGDEDVGETGRPAPLATRDGSALSRSADGRWLFVADEDHAALRKLPLPLPTEDGHVESLELPGRPAQVLALRGRALVTLRDPGKLLLVATGGSAMTIASSVDVPADAWGVAVTHDEKTALVTSAWTHRVTAVDLATGAVRWSVDVAREPRGVVVARDGTAYVSHLIGREITVLTGADGDVAPDPKRVDLPAARLRTPRGHALSASLGYALVLSPDDKRLFAPRHALGAQALESWFGTSSVDVLLTRSLEPLAPPRATVEARDLSEGTMNAFMEGAGDVEGAAVLTSPALIQPRAAIYRARTRTVLVAGEGSNTVVEVDALAIDPTLSPVRTWSLGAIEPARTAVDWKDPYARPLASGGAPSGLALDAEERHAYVYCRTTNEIVTIDLEPAATQVVAEAPLRLVDDELSYEAARGRRLFFDATDGVVSGGLACAGCHPDGREDGHVWQEVPDRGFRARPEVYRNGNSFGGVPRQTPMLAGRVKPVGPYGWKAESKTLEDRVRESFGLHRWSGGFTPGPTMDRPKLIAAYLREGLVPPPRDVREPRDEERRGKELFEDPVVGCAVCHVPSRDFTDRVAYDLKRSLSVPGFLPEKDPLFKTPSLLFVGGSAPYFHDGRAGTLEQALFESGGGMGKTGHLSAADRAALVAYVRSL